MEIPAFRCPQELHQFLTQRKSIWCIDGFMGSGKSWLASSISRKTPQRSIIRGDAFICEQITATRSYMEVIDASRLNECVRLAAPNVVFEGVFARQLLALDLLEKAKFVYVKKLGYPRADWDDGETLYRERTAGLNEDVREYHLEYLPHKKADAFFEWIELAPSKS